MKGPSISLFCNECENNDSFLMWATTKGNICAECDECGAIQTWEA